MTKFRPTEPKPSIAAPSDESRERAKKLWAKFQRDEGVKHHTIDNWPVRLIESAERDTRELCAQLARLMDIPAEFEERFPDIYRSYMNGEIEMGEAVAEAVLAESIHGKGEA